MGKAYDVFISYSHEADQQLAHDLGTGLKGMNRKWHQRRALEVFHDQSSLSASPDLWESLAVHLDDARYLLVLLSPDAAESSWVNREIAHFLDTHDSDRLLLALTDGELDWDDAAGGFAATSTAAPAALEGRLDGEPLWVDARWARHAPELSLRDSRFRSTVATLAAPVHGMDKDDLEGEDVRAHRQQVRVRRLATGALILLLTLVAAASVLALVFRGQTAAERELRREVEAANAELDDSNAALAQSNADLETANADLDRANTELDEANSELTDTNAELDDSNAQLAFVNALLDATNVDLQASNVELDAANVELNATNGRLDATNVELNATNGRLDAANADLSATNDQLDTANRSLEVVNGQLEESEAFASRAAGIAICTGDLVAEASTAWETATTDLINRIESINAEVTALQHASDPDRIQAGLDRIFSLSFIVQTSGTFIIRCDRQPGFPFTDRWGELQNEITAPPVFVIGQG